MKILGISPDVWISSAALVENGNIVAAAAEERFDRQKMSNAFPHQAIDFCLAETGGDLGDVDYIVIPWNPGIHIRSASARYTDSMRWRGEYLVAVPTATLKHLGGPEISEIEQVLHLTNGDLRFKYVNHHMAHAASAFFLSPYEEAAIFTMDGRGEDETCTFGFGRGNQIKKTQSVFMPHSIGLLYSTMTEFLGFKPHTDEWKVMALASFGNPDTATVSKIRSLFTLIEDGGFELDLTYFDYYHFDRRPHLFTEKLENLLGPARISDSALEPRHQDIASALQQVFEEIATHMLTSLYEKTGQKRLVLAGGAAMNSVYNGRITSMTPFEEVFIPSCPDDTGVSVGAALYVYNTVLGNTRGAPQTHNNWGPSYSDTEIQESLARYGFRTGRQENIAEAAAHLIADGKLVGWFQGAMEFGQRALGNRSILADPRNPDAKRQINSAVKFREEFRPFAPAVLAECANEWFDVPDGVSVPFMERVYPVKELKRTVIPAVVHIDGSGRLQTVTREANPRFHDLISIFGDLTGVPIVVNTSFNLNGEPIVCSPIDAIRTFYSCGLDALAIGDFLIEKQMSVPIPRLERDDG